MNTSFTRLPSTKRGLTFGTGRLTLAAACVFAFGLAFSFNTTAAEGVCNVQCETYCFTQFMWCGGFANENCYPQYVECAQACGCDLGG
jgi:hypothetical protein